MGILFKLYLLKIKGQLRNIFNKPSSAIFVSILILIYGVAFIGSLLSENPLASANLISVHQAVLINIAFSAFLIGTMLLQKRKSLLFENDAFYLFTGPFKRTMIMKYLMLQAVISALLIGATCMIMLVIFGMGISFDAPFLLLIFLSQAFAYVIFLNLLDYLYLLAIDNPKLKNLAKIIVGAFGCIVAIIFLIVLAQQDYMLKNGAMAFLESDLFYIVPVFGWIKLILISYITHSYAMVLLGCMLMFITGGIIFILMTRYKGNFIEQAMVDAQEYSAIYKEMKAGKRMSMNDQKMRDVSTTFQPGAKAIFSKNMLLMRKVNNFVSKQDIIVLGIYFVVAFIADLGFGFFCYMLIFWLFSMVQNSDLMQDMNNYQIYLIPDNPLRKLFYLVLPTLLKIVILMSVVIIAGIFVFQMGLLEALQYYILLLGYSCLFLSASVLSLRILKSRNNAILEGMLRMLITVVAAIPSIVIVILFIVLGGTTIDILLLMAIVSAIVNVIISFVILISCKNMLNGREIKSE